MYDNDSKGISYTAGFFMLIAFTIAGFVISSGYQHPGMDSNDGQELLQIWKKE